MEINIQCLYCGDLVRLVPTDSTAYCWRPYIWGTWKVSEGSHCETMLKHDLAVKYCLKCHAGWCSKHFNKMYLSVISNNTPKGKKCSCDLGFLITSGCSCGGT